VLRHKKIAWEASDIIDTLQDGIAVLRSIANNYRERVGPEIDFVANKLDDSIERLQGLLETACDHAGISLVRLPGDDTPEAAEPQP